MPRLTRETAENECMNIVRRREPMYVKYDMLAGTMRAKGQSARNEHGRWRDGVLRGARGPPSFKFIADRISDRLLIRALVLLPSLTSPSSSPCLPTVRPTVTSTPRSSPATSSSPPSPSARVTPVSTAGRIRLFDCFEYLFSLQIRFATRSPMPSSTPASRRTPSPRSPARPRRRPA